MKLFQYAILYLLLFGCEAKIKTQSENFKSWAFPYFEKADSLNPILSPTLDLKFLDPITNNTVKWEERNVLNPTAIV